MGKSQSKLTSKELLDLQENTDFTQEEIKAWYKSFIHDYPEGRLSKEEFKRFHERFFPSGDPGQFAGYIFDVFDTDHNGEISFKEFICPLSLTSRGDPDEKLEWVFQLYDINHDGTITYDELLQIVQSVYKMVGQMVINKFAKDEDTPEKRVDKIFASMDRDKDAKLTYVEFVDGSKQDPAIVKALSLYDDFV